MQIIFYLTIVLLIIIMGLPLFFVFNNEDDKVIMFPLSALYGTAEIIFIGFWLSYVGVPMGVAYYIILILTACMWLIVYIRTKDKIIRIFKRDEKSSVFFICISLLAGGLTLIPMVFFNACFPYGDMYTYICMADFLKDNGYNTAINLDGYSPWLSQMYLYQIQHLRVGAQILLAFWSGFFQQQFSIELYAPISGVGIFLVGCGTWVFIFKNYSQAKKAQLCGVVFSAFNAPIIIWCAIYGFLPQVFGMVFMLVALAFIINILNSNTILSPPIISTTCFFIAVTALIYSEIIPFLVLSVATILIYRIGTKDISFFLVVKRMCILLVCTIILLGTYFTGMIKAILGQLTAVVGWNQTVNWWGYLGYLFSTVPISTDYKSLDYSIFYKLFFTGITLCMITISILGIERIKNKKILKDFMVLSIPYGLMLIYFTSITPNPFEVGVGNSWGVFKLVQYYFIIFIPFFSVFISSLYIINKKFNNILFNILIFTFILGSMTNAFYFSKNVVVPMQEMTGNKTNPMDEYYNLYKMYKDEDRPINLIGLPDAHRKMVTYILKENKLVSNWETDNYFGILAGGGYDNPTYREDGITLRYDETNENKKVVNLVEYSENTIFYEAGEGVGVVEKNKNDYWTWNAPRAVYNIINYSQKDNITISFEASCANEDDDSKLYIISEGKVLKEIKLLSNNRSEITLNVNVQNFPRKEIEFLYKGKPMVGGDDTRKLYFCIWNFKIDDLS